MYLCVVMCGPGVGALLARLASLHCNMRALFALFCVVHHFFLDFFFYFMPFSFNFSNRCLLIILQKVPTISSVEKCDERGK